MVDAPIEFKWSYLDNNMDDVIKKIAEKGEQFRIQIISGVQMGCEESNKIIRDKIRERCYERGSLEKSSWLYPEITDTTPDNYTLEIIYENFAIDNEGNFYAAYQEDGTEDDSRFTFIHGKKSMTPIMNPHTERYGWKKEPQLSKIGLITTQLGGTRGIPASHFLADSVNDIKDILTRSTFNAVTSVQEEVIVHRGRGRPITTHWRRPPYVARMLHVRGIPYTRR